MKKSVVGALFALASVIGATGTMHAAPAQPAIDRTSYRLDATYTVSVDINWRAGTMRVTTLMKAINRSGGKISRLELNTIAPRLGSMTQLHVEVDGSAVDAHVDDQTIVVDLPNVLAKDGEVTVRTSYKSHFRHDGDGNHWLWSQHNDVLSVYRFVPWLSRRVAFDAPNIGDPFVTPVSRKVRVTFTSSVPLVYAAAGTRHAGSGSAATFVARNVRDFNFAASPGYHATTQMSVDGETKLTIFSRWSDDDHIHHLLGVARRALEQYEHWVGPYPYPSFVIAETPGKTAVESPGLVWVGRGVRYPEYVVAHELAHQWFYALVGNDQSKEPFHDEALADYLSRSFTGLLRGSRCATRRLDRSIYAYPEECYHEVIYVQGSQFLEEIRVTMGSNRFWTTLRRYVAHNAFTISSTRRLLEAFRRVEGDSLLPRYQKRFPNLYPS